MPLPVTCALDCSGNPVACLWTGWVEDLSLTRSPLPSQARPTCLLDHRCRRDVGGLDWVDGLWSWLWVAGQGSSEGAHR